MEELKPSIIGDSILFKDHQLIIFNKPNGLATVSQNKKVKTLHDLAEIYCRQELFPLHRLDQPTSGVILFAKNKKALSKLSVGIRERKVKKIYWAWVKGTPPKEGELTDYLFRDGKMKKAKIVQPDYKNAKQAKLKFKTLKASTHYTLLEIELITGRFHQIRAQLANQGWPIQGDEKYGARRGNPDRSIALHARSLTFAHPTKGQQMTFEAPPPQSSLWDTL